MASKSKIVMKRALRGLYAGRHIRFGNKVSEDGGNKTRRSWKPNRQKKRLFSLGLDQYVWLDVTTHALRCIDRVGGLDEYLLKIPEKTLESEKLVHLRRCIAAAYKKCGNSILPPDLEGKLKAVMEWHSRATEEEEEQVDDEEGSEFSQERYATGTDSAEINDRFSRFNLGQEWFKNSPQGGGRGEMGGIFPEASQVPSAEGSEPSAVALGFPGAGLENQGG